MQIRCIAIDDEPLALELIEEYVSKFQALQLVHTFDDAVSGAEFLRHTPIDLLFIDINMPDITGIELVKSLEQKPLIIFTTAYRKFAVEGFELEALDYLLKPLDFERFTKAVNRVIDYFKYKASPENETNESIFIRADYKMLRIELKQVEYIESQKDYIKIFFSNDKPLLARMPLKTVLEKLPENTFKRIHRSYIVNADKIKSVLKSKVILTNAVELPVSDNYSSSIEQWLS